MGIETTQPYGRGVVSLLKKLQRKIPVIFDDIPVSENV
jgi:hypothetical protein